jgi:MOSC domain-containing protein YiiM
LPTVEKQPVVRINLELFGVSGDRHAGELWTPTWGRHKDQTVFNERQWSAVSAEEIGELERSLGVALPLGALGENFRFEGVARLSKLRPGTRISFPSGAALWVSGENFPCRKAALRLAQLTGQPGLTAAFLKAARGRRGLVGWVETPGPVQLGDPASFSFGG